MTMAQWGIQFDKDMENDSEKDLLSDVRKESDGGRQQKVPEK